MIQIDTHSSNTLSQSIQDNLNSMQQLMLLLRRIQLGIDFFILFYIVGRIVLKKFYKYKTLKLFLVVVLCYLIGLVSILLHYQSFIPQKFKYIYSKRDNLSPNFYDMMSNFQPTEKLLCGGEAFINLFFYDLGYFFSVLITYNVYCVINGSYRTSLNNTKSKIFVLLMLIIYALPWIFLCLYQNQENYWYSYAPTGFKWEEQGLIATLLLYCGPQSKQDTLWQIISILNTYICPIVMVCCHSVYIIRNKRKISSLEVEEYLNTNQKFLIESGQIGVVVFSIQLLNLLKTSMSFIPSNSSWYLISLTVLNFIFDLYPIPLAYFFHKYTRQAEKVERGSNTMLQYE